MGYQLLSETQPVARNDYQCIWCPERILKGEKHIHEVSKYDGDLQDHRWHLECKKAADENFRKNEEPEFDPNSFKRGSFEGL